MQRGKWRGRINWSWYSKPRHWRMGGGRYVLIEGTEIYHPVQNSTRYVEILAGLDGALSMLRCESSMVTVSLS